MDRLINLYNQYYNKVIIWFGGLSFLGQITALTVGFFAVCMIVAFFIMRRMAR
ncbi:MAG TPA: hypothetical protein VEF33_01215 [Syntrophales bacterium]|nr:hypothetical protein [Syntrophales bacterium]